MGGIPQRAFDTTSLRILDRMAACLGTTRATPNSAFPNCRISEAVGGRQHRRNNSVPLPQGEKQEADREATLMKYPPRPDTPAVATPQEYSAGLRIPTWASPYGSCPWLSSSLGVTSRPNSAISPDRCTARTPGRTSRSAQVGDLHIDENEFTGCVPPSLKDQSDLGGSYIRGLPFRRSVLKGDTTPGTNIIRGLFLPDEGRPRALPSKGCP